MCASDVWPNAETLTHAILYSARVAAEDNSRSRRLTASSLDRLVQIVPNFSRLTQAARIEIEIRLAARGHLMAVRSSWVVRARLAGQSTDLIDVPRLVRQSFADRERRCDAAVAAVFREVARVFPELFECGRGREKRTNDWLLNCNWASDITPNHTLLACVCEHGTTRANIQAPRYQSLNQTLLSGEN